MCHAVVKIHSDLPPAIPQKIILKVHGKDVSHAQTVEKSKHEETTNTSATKECLEKGL
jgi:hypothetical protein